MNFTTTIHADWAIGGAPDSVYNGRTEAGKVFLFKKAGERWNFHSFLLPGATAAEKHFGSDIALFHHHLLVAADCAISANLRNVYIYTLQDDAWTLTDCLRGVHAILPLSQVFHQWNGNRHIGINGGSTAAAAKGKTTRSLRFMPYPLAFRFLQFMLFVKLSGII